MMPRTKGFSLLELMLVMVLIAIAFAVLLPRWTGPSKGSLNSTVHDLVNALQECKLQAMTSGKLQTFVWNPATRQWRTATRQGNIPAPIEVSLIYAKDTTQSGREPSIDFSPDGRSTGARLSLQQGQQQRTLNVDWLTAQVHVSVASK